MIQNFTQGVGLGVPSYHGHLWVPEKAWNFSHSCVTCYILKTLWCLKFKRSAAQHIHGMFSRPSDNQEVRQQLWQPKTPRRFHNTPLPWATLIQFTPTQPSPIHHLCSLSSNRDSHNSSGNTFSISSK